MTAITRELAWAVGRKVHALRKAAGLTRLQVAERAGVSRRFVSAVERGDSNTRGPGVVTLVLLARALGVKAAELLPEGV